MNKTPSPSLSLADVIRAMRVSVAAWGGLGWLSTALVWLLYRRLGEIGGRMERLAARFRAGRLRQVEPRVGTRREAVAARAVGAERIWPTRYGWLVRAASWHAAAYTSQLRVVLTQPEMVELLLAAPQAARILRPLCRMLAVETSLLRPGVAAAEMAPEAAPETPAPVKRVRAKQPPVDWGRIPLPRGVLAAARRDRALNRW